MRIGRKGKLSQWYIGPFEFLDRVGTIAYQVIAKFVLSSQCVYVLVLRKFESDPLHVLDYERSK